MSVVETPKQLDDDLTLNELVWVLKRVVQEQQTRIDATDARMRAAGIHDPGCGDMDWDAGRFKPCDCWLSRNEDQ